MVDHSGPIDPNHYYSVQEAADTLNIHRLTFRSHLEGFGGNIPYYKIGDQYRVLGAEINKEFGSATYNPESQQTSMGQSGAVVHDNG